ncbi:MAG: YchJ family protein [Halodesulfovibrio sp.]
MSTCPCGSGLTLETCCGPIIHDGKPAATAEALMRSRYTAHVLGVYEYLNTSMHPSVRGQDTVDDIEQWSSKIEWKGLEILSTSAGAEGDSVGEVEFVARYDLAGVPQQLNELAEFRKEGDYWYYVDGKVRGHETVRRETPKVGRNEPCPCGSGKKFKKCCG